MKSTRLIGALMCLMAWAVPGKAGTELITNGGFETGDFSGWSVADLGSGSWFASSSTLTPLSLFPTAGSASGGFYAVTDQTGPGTHVLLQDFTIPGPGTTTLRFDMFANDQDGGPIIDPIGLDHSFGPNQHARVDILSASAGPFDTGAGVLSPLYIGVDSQLNNPNPYTHYVFDLTGAVGMGGTYTLRFGEVDNQGFLHLGVDNVSIDFVPVPEPGVGWMPAVIFGLVLIGVRRRADG